MAGGFEQGSKNSLKNQRYQWFIGRVLVVIPGGEYFSVYSPVGQALNQGRFRPIKAPFDLPGPGNSPTTFMEVLAARCAVRETSRHDNGVPDPGTLRAPSGRPVVAGAVLAPGDE